MFMMERSDMEGRLLQMQMEGEEAKMNQTIEIVEEDEEERKRREEEEAREKEEEEERKRREEEEKEEKRKQNEEELRNVRITLEQERYEFAQERENLLQTIDRKEDEIEELKKLLNGFTFPGFNPEKLNEEERRRNYNGEKDDRKDKNSQLASAMKEMQNGLIEDARLRSLLVAEKWKDLTRKLLRFYRLVCIYI